MKNAAQCIWQAVVGCITRNWMSQPKDLLGHTKSSVFKLQPTAAARFQGRRRVWKSGGGAEARSFNHNNVRHYFCCCITLIKSKWKRSAPPLPTHTPGPLPLAPGSDGTWFTIHTSQSSPIKMKTFLCMPNPFGCLKHIGRNPTFDRERHWAEIGQTLGRH